MTATKQDELLPAAEVAPVPVPAEQIWLTRPGLYDIPEADYHADPVPGGSLSCSVAKKLLEKCPAIAKYEMENPPAHKDAWDLGSVFHGKVLGRGGVPAVFPGSWNTNKIKAEIAEARAAGLVPLKPEALATAERMAAAVLADPDAAPLFAEGTGLAERTIVWTHERTGTPMRSMLDWLSLAPGMPPLIVDLKSTKDVSPRGIRKDVTEYRYYQQDPFYRAAVASLGYDLADVGFVFVFVGSTPPHLVTVTVLDEEAVAEGMACNEDAVDLWVRCHETGEWPGYSEDIETISLPRWAVTHG
jgi:hypothetical protein